MSIIPNILVNKRIQEDFFIRDVLEVAPELPGKYLVTSQNGILSSFIITEVEAYRGEDDCACHAHKGRTPRTDIMYHKGGFVYVYLIYGRYWMFNIVTGLATQPQAALVRGLQTIYGPGRLTQKLGIDRTFYGENLTCSKRIWLVDNTHSYTIKAGKRIGIDYAGEPWASKPWRYYINP